MLVFYLKCLWLWPDGSGVWGQARLRTSGTEGLAAEQTHALA